MSVTVNDNQYKQLARLVPLNTLSDDVLSSLLMQIDIETLPKGSVLFKEGDVDHVNFYLLRGKIGLFAGGVQDDVLDESSPTIRFPVAHQVPRRFTAKALSKIGLVRIDSRVLSEALAKNEADNYEVDEVDATVEDNDWMSQLLQSRVMQQIPAANLQGVMMRMQEVEVTKGTDIITEGDEGDFYYLLNKGQAVVLKRDENGENKEIVRLGAGASFGEDALLSDSPRSSTVRMLTDGVLLRLSKEDFIELIRHPLSESVSYQEALGLVENGAVWLDVRDPEAYEERHLPGAINMPYNTLRFQIPSLDTDRQYIIYSQSGKKGIASAYLFLERDLQVSILDGGFSSVPVEPEAEVADETLDEDSIQETSELQPAESSAVADPDEIRQLREELDQVRRERDELARQSQGLEREVIGLSEQLESEEAVYDKLKSQYDALSSDHKKHLQVREADLAVLKEKLTVLQLERDEFESDLEELQQQAGNSTDAGAEISEALRQANNKISELEALNASVVTERDALASELEDLRNRFSLVTQEASELELENADLKHQLQELQDSHQVS